MVPDDSLQGVWWLLLFRKSMASSVDNFDVFTGVVDANRT